MDNVFVKSGEQPRYFGWGTSESKSTTTSGMSNPNYGESPYQTYQANLSGVGSLSAAVSILGTNDPTTAQGLTQNWVTLGSMSLSGTTSACSGFAYQGPWRWVAANCTAISGKSAALEVIQGV